MENGQQYHSIPEFMLLPSFSTVYSDTDSNQYTTSNASPRGATPSQQETATEGRSEMTNVDNKNAQPHNENQRDTNA
eukprot:15297942-Ditylum_brightwellii.AAC.1